MPVRSAAHAVRLIDSRDKPLALYMFSEDRAVKEPFRPKLPFSVMRKARTGIYHWKF